MDSLTRKQIAKRTRYFNRRSLSKSSIKEKIIIGVVLAIFIIYAISLLYPFIYLIINSFKDQATDLTPSINYETWETIQPNYFGLPSKWVFSNYATVFKGIQVGTTTTSIVEMYFNSITLSIGETAVSMFLTCSAAYVLAKYQFRGNRLVYNVVLIASFIPAIAALPAIYSIMNDTGLTGTYVGMLVLNASAFGGPFLFIHSYFKQVPWSFAESAMMDGASDFRIFGQIMLPLAKNGIVTFTILRFLGYWNDYWYPQLFYKDRPTIAVGIAAISADSSIPMPVVSAAMILAIVPVLIGYAIFQKKLLANTIDGGLK